MPNKSISELIKKLTALVEQSDEEGMYYSETQRLCILAELKAMSVMHKCGNDSFKGLLKSFVAPTGALQEMSIDNGWGQEFVDLSGLLDEFIES